MIIIDRIVAAFSAVTSNPIMHQQQRAMMVPSWSRKKLKPLTSAPGTGLQTVRSSSANLRCARGLKRHFMRPGDAPAGVAYLPANAPPATPVVKLQSCVEVCQAFVSILIALSASSF